MCLDVCRAAAEWKLPVFNSWDEIRNVPIRPASRPHVLVPVAHNLLMLAEHLQLLKHWNGKSAQKWWQSIKILHSVYNLCVCDTGIISLSTRFFFFLFFFLQELGGRSHRWSEVIQLTWSDHLWGCTSLCQSSFHCCKISSVSRTNTRRISLKAN